MIYKNPEFRFLDGKFYFHKLFVIWPDSWFTPKSANVRHIASPYDSIKGRPRGSSGFNFDYPKNIPAADIT